MHQGELLNGIRVLELSPYTANSYAGRLLSLSGADVTKVITPPLLFSSFYDDQKTIISIEKFERMIREKADSASWDIVLTNGDYEKYVRNLNKKVQLEIAYPFHIEDEEQDLQARYSWAALTGEEQDEGLFIGGQPATSLLGAHIASAALFALLNGVERKIDIDVNTIMISALEAAFVNYKERNVVPSPNGNRHHALSPMAILQAKNDEKIFVGAPTSAQWSLLADWAEIEGKETWLDDEERFQSTEEVERLLSQWTERKSADELFQMGQLFRLPFAKVQTIKQVKNCIHLQSRNFFHKKNEVIKSVNLPWQISLNKSREVSLQKVVSAKLDELRIIDLTSMWSGPYCTRLFADEGAEVIKIEAPFRPDGIRANEDDQVPFFKELNRNKLSVTLDLTDEIDREAFLQLVKRSDVIVDNFSPRVMENLQLTKEVLWRYNPQLIIISMSAFGATGPYRNYVGYGPTLECMAGVASLTKASNGKSYLPGFSISDMLAGIHSAFSLLGALYARKRGRSGIKVDISQYETTCQVVGSELSGATRRTAASRKADIQAFLTTIEDYPPAKIKLSDGSETIGLPWGDVGGKRESKKAPRFGEDNALLYEWQSKR